MKALRKLFDTTFKKVVALALVLLLLVWLVLFFVARDTAFDLVQPILWTLVVVTVAWVGIHFGVRAWRKRKRTEFDQKVAAKEGIEDRRREWNTWTAELEKQDIDRYELPFYLLVGEPQSGKSVLLQNSDLHFPFGQNRLSGVGGTRGCDWWFTEEAVILDLAGRLFTHEGGAADRLEFEAFLQLLYDFRPLCPVNGVILVIPCDSLARDNAEQCGAKATKIQNALLTLTTQLQAQLPVYLVFTKGDQIFGFAESVHRLDVERRHQMFGWSRPAEKLDTPFDVAEVVAGFDELVKRARLLRAHMTAGARLPEALPEVDRMYAFPDELQSLQPNLELYLKRIFTASNVTDRVFFRGLYLTSGLQTGVPIAKVCTDLFGQAGEADRRNLDALFSKQRAYFIKDLVQKRIFAERGLVRPTQGRVQQTRRTSTFAYGLAGAIVLASLVGATVYLAKDRSPEQTGRYSAALQAGKAAAAAPQGMAGLLYALQQIDDAATYDTGDYEEVFAGAKDDFEQLYRGVFDRRMVPLVHAMALDVVEDELAKGRVRDHDRLLQVCDAVIALTREDVDLSDESTRRHVLGVLPDATSERPTVAGGTMLSLSRAFELRLERGSSEGLLSKGVAETGRLVRLARLAFTQLEGCLEPGARTQPGGQLGYMVAWRGAETAHEALISGPPSGTTIPTSVTFASCMQILKRIEDGELGSNKSVDYGKVIIPLGRLRLEYHTPLQDFLLVKDPEAGKKSNWPRVQELVPFVNEKFQGFEGPLNLSAIGAHFGSEDFGQTAFQMLEGMIGVFSSKFQVPGDHDPQKDLTAEVKLLDVCVSSLPADLRGGGLAKLGSSVSDLDTRVLGDLNSPQAKAVFQQQCVEVALAFPRQLPDSAAAIAAFEAGGGDVATAAPLFAELVGFHRALRAAIEKHELKGETLRALRACQAHVEALLDELLTKRGPASAWMPPVTAAGTLDDRAWGILDVLLQAAALEQARPELYLQRTASDAAAGAFAAQGEALYETWLARPPDQLKETVRSVQELGLIAQAVARRPALAALRGVELEAWMARVDTLLTERMGPCKADVERLWKPELDLDRPLPDVLTKADLELNGIADKIAESQKRGLSDIGVLVKELDENGPIRKWLAMQAAAPVIAELREWAIPATPAQVTGDPQYQQLDRAIDQVRACTTGEAYAAEYARSFAGSPPPPPAPNAGVRLVQRLRADFAQRLRREVREQYLASLQKLLEGPRYKDLLEVLFWQQGDDVSSYDDTDVRDKLDSLLKKKKGELEQLLESYALTGERSIRAEVFPAGIDEDEWAAVHRFLVELADFLRAGDEKSASVKLSRFQFSLVPQAAAGSVWDLKALPVGERKDSFYYPEDDSADGLQKASLGPDIEKPRKVSNWGFEVNRDERQMLLVWSKQPTQADACRDPQRYEVSIPGCLAPLLLAWSGNPRDDEQTEFEVSPTLTGTQRLAPMRIQFERPLPVRPPKP